VFDYFSPIESGLGTELELGGDEGIFVKSGPKLHMQYFSLGKTESANRMITLQIFETLLGSIATFFTSEAKLQFG
jgi:hypothetical protein